MTANDPRHGHLRERPEIQADFSFCGQFGMFPHLIILIFMKLGKETPDARVSWGKKDGKSVNRSLRVEPPDGQ
jgi:hypothetical protein